MEVEVNTLDSRTVEDDISPVTLSSDWSRVARLLLVASLAVIGSLGNVYMISAVMIEDHLKKRGNIFVVNVALADLLITGIIMPASAVVILAGIHVPEWLCNVQWSLAILSCLVTIQQVYELGPDYCKRKNSGILFYQATVAALFVILPAILTTVFYARTIMQVRLARTHPSFKPPVAFAWDYSLMKTNMYSFFLFFIFWLPFGVLLFIGSLKTISPRLFYNLAWFALSKSCVNNFLYCLTDRHFRNAYINIFHYCCCKTTVTFSRRTRGEIARPSGDVRVHIIPGYNMYSYTSPQRNRENSKGSSSKRASGTSRQSRPLSRDVYEL
ncbi:hypothetical protein O3M35_002708 [Rhynocoris fuscipes]|uniref:G-protein coupled receptors family 1 profile domain-containing protein n=1 Tax=Rhynocoris fuscipes TaxID=488301 RepID=A0AAW1CMC6_9HEMI